MNRHLKTALFSLPVLLAAVCAWAAAPAAKDARPSVAVAAVAAPASDFAGGPMLEK